MAEEKKNLFDYDEDSIKTLDWQEHIRLRPGMYIGKLGDGSSPDDGIYVLMKEVIDNCIDEHTMGYGKHVDITMEKGVVTVRDYGRGIPLGKVVDVVSKVNTGAKFDSKVFQKSVGLNGVGTKAVNALSSYFKVTAFREGKEKTAEFEKGILVKDHKEQKTTEENGTLVTFTPDDTVFKNYHYIHEYMDNQFWNYCYLNAGLVINFNGKKYVSKNGFIDTFSNISAVADDTAVTLRAKYVTQIGNHFTNFEGATYFGDETAYRLGADLYIDPTLSVGVSFMDTTFDDFDTVWAVRAQKFFTPAIAVGLDYTTTEDADSYGINGTFRL